MYIKQKRVKTVRAKLSDIPADSNFVIVAPNTSLSTESANHIRLGELAIGESSLPHSEGPLSEFNAEGRYQVHKDRPKEYRYINTIEWEWKQWKGRGATETISEFHDVYRECYPRTFLPPPSVELYPVQIDGKRWYASPTMRNSELNYPIIGHVINLFLEIFGECELRREDHSLFTQLKVRRLNWELLPPGRHPWLEEGSNIQTRLRNMDKRISAPVIHRQNTIQKYSPKEIAMGLGGFSNYIAYIFPDLGLVLLESMEYGNATYVLKDDWEVVSQMTKAEILSKGLHEKRLIHSKGWENRLAEVLQAQPRLASVR